MFADYLKATIKGLWGVGCVLSLHGCGNTSQPAENEMATESDSSDSDSSTSIGTDSSENGPASNISWITLEPGTFTMGSPDAEWGRSENELRHTVEQVYRFEIASTEITIAQWRLLDVSPDVVDMSLYFSSQSEDATDNAISDDLPVSVTSIEVVTQWLDALSVAEGLTPCYTEATNMASLIHCPGYRLPTESEWERAARGGDDRATYNGDFSGDNFSGGMPTALEPIAWCGSRTASVDEIIPHPVGQLAPNDFGLYDMIGNVSEWTHWEGVYSAEPTQGGATISETQLFTNRGGSCGSHGMGFYGCRAASRQFPYGMDSTYTSETGFRPVRTLPDSAFPTIQTDSECVIVPPVEDCEVSDALNNTLLLSAETGAQYIDVQKIKSREAMAVLGQSETNGPFVEILSYWDNFNSSITPIQLATPSPQLRAVLLRTAADEDKRIAVTLCDGVQCSLYRVEDPAVNSGDAAATEILPFDKGEIPQWIGEINDIAYVSSPLQIWVAGNGIARFDGMEWTPITADTSIVVNSLYVRINVDGQAILVAAGEQGFLGVEEEDGWRRISVSTDAALNDVQVEWDTTGWMISAVGEKGAFVQGPMNAPQVCTLGEENLNTMIYPSARTKYAIYTESGMLYL